MKVRLRYNIWYDVLHLKMPEETHKLPNDRLGYINVIFVKRFFYYGGFAV